MVLDIIVAVLLLFGAYKGFRRGLIIEIATLIGLVLGIYGGMYFSDYASMWIVDNFEVKAGLLPIVSFLLTFIVIVAGVFVLAKALEKVVNLVALKLINKLAGALFGLLKMGLIVSLLLLLANVVDAKTGILPDNLKNDSILYEPLSLAVDTILPFLRNSDWYEAIA